jgi:hypothetical protein
VQEADASNFPDGWKTDLIRKASKKPHPRSEVSYKRYLIFPLSSAKLYLIKTSREAAR